MTLLYIYIYTLFKCQEKIFLNSTGLHNYQFSRYLMIQDRQINEKKGVGVGVIGLVFTVLWQVAVYSIVSVL